MRIKTSVLLVMGLLLALSTGYWAAQAQSEGEIPNTLSDDHLVIVWTSGDRDVALKMVFMYAYNSPRFEWWEDVTLIVWGPSAKLLSEDTELQEYVQKMAEAGITLKACKACSDMYEVSDKLTELGVDVKYMGDELTNFVKGDSHVLTF